MLKVVPRINRFENRYACNEYIKFIRACKDYNHKKFIVNLTKNKDKFVMATHGEGKLAELFIKLN